MRIPIVLPSGSEALLFILGINQAVMAVLTTIPMEVIAFHQVVAVQRIARGLDGDLFEIVVIHSVQCSIHDLTDLSDGKIVFGQVNDDLNRADLNVIEDEHLSKRDVIHSILQLRKDCQKKDFLKGKNLYKGMISFGKISFLERFDRGKESLYLM